MRQPENLFEIAARLRLALNPSASADIPRSNFRQRVPKLRVQKLFINEDE